MKILVGLGLRRSLRYRTGLAWAESIRMKRFSAHPTFGNTEIVLGSGVPSFTGKTPSCQDGEFLPYLRQQPRSTLSIRTASVNPGTLFGWAPYLDQAGTEIRFSAAVSHRLVRRFHSSMPSFIPFHFFHSIPSLPFPFPFPIQISFPSELNRLSKFKSH